MDKTFTRDRKKEPISRITWIIQPVANRLDVSIVGKESFPLTLTVVKIEWPARTISNRKTAIIQAEFSDQDALVRKVLSFHGIFRGF